MEKFIPLEKQSKKKQKEYHAKHRNDWGCISPVSKSVPSGKTYNRKKLKAKEKRSSGSYREDGMLLLFCY